MTPTQIPCVIVGGGQAGLSASYYLCRDGVDHVVLERHRTFHAWRHQRWDTFCLVTPNWQCRLPGHPYDGDDPEGFMVREEILDYVHRFTERFDPPVREGVTATDITRRPDGRFYVATDAGDWLADQVVIATGGYDAPIIPDYAAKADARITQVETREYHRPDDLPDGAVLVVGTGQSGAQLMEDLHIAGRKVHLAVGPAPRAPRRYRGRDSTDWLHEMGHYDMTLADHPDGQKAREKTNHYMSGRDGGHEIDLRRFAREGVSLYGRLTDLDGTVARFAPDLEANLDSADATYLSIRQAIDGYIDKHGIDAPVAVPFEKVWRPEAETTEIDLDAEGITAILWCIGFRADYSWIDVPAFDEGGVPVHARGVADVPGFYFLGLPWLHTWGSGRFLSVGDDAAHVAGHIARSHRRRRAS